ncbi:hypothetical protein [Dolosicoccus paucivorans]|uniref:Transposase n=1 Tax=Dolosicoccus paucivorans TaxID=84521 RepID=A0A1G8N8L2_9LACT|nr:hypothetical protein [Dolosicoccus paucivorans]PMB83597.1 hypothetical protein CJ206_08270 [Dolosicoccus paucivorans]PMC57175.1 hypothetical protein CJ205_08130 [Dolosicoccus paucivorans]SDI76538.1 hypothetical protein SAMN04487994_10443 [Dolosicoccus paucivorans]
MSKKYRYEFKMRVVEEYFEEKLGYMALAKKYNISAKSLVRQWVNILKENKIFQNMSRKGNYLDNSPMENFFGILKKQCIMVNL